jgi:UDPglucose 6-dehydrogenase
VQALIHSAEEVNYDFSILKAVEAVNERQKKHLLPKIMRYFNNNLKGVRLALWGLAFKPNTDDIREAPALHLIEALTKEGAQIMAFDPEAMNNVKRLLGDVIEYAANPYAALDGADALVIATEWSEFRTPDFDRISQTIKNKVIFDGRNLFDVKQMKSLGYHYESVGRGTDPA